MTNVMIVDDERLIVDLFTRYIQSASDRYTLVSVISNAANAEARCCDNDIDLILMDICTAKKSSGLAAAEKIKKRVPRTKIIIVTSAPEHRFLEKARAAGAESFWYKNVSQDELLDVMDRTMAGESIYPDKTPEVPFGLVSSYDLSQKEIEVLHWLSLVGSNKAIAEKMGVSEDGIDYHIRSLKEKTGCESKIELAILAASSKLVLPDY